MSLRFHLLCQLSETPITAERLSDALYGLDDLGVVKTQSIITSLRANGWGIYSGPGGYILNPKHVLLVSIAKEVFKHGAPPFGSPKHLQLILTIRRRNSQKSTEKVR